MPRLDRNPCPYPHRSPSPKLRCLQRKHVVSQILTRVRNLRHPRPISQQFHTQHFFILRRSTANPHTRQLAISLTCELAKNKPAPLGIYPSGAVPSAKEPVSRILSCAVIPLGAASPRTLISDLPGGFGTCSNRLSRTGPIRLAAGFFGFASPSLFGLAPCGVYPASRFTAGAVRSYRTFSPLPRREKSKLSSGG